MIAAAAATRRLRRAATLRQVAAVVADATLR